MPQKTTNKATASDAIVRHVNLIYDTVRVGSFRGKKFPSNPVIESTGWIKRGNRWVAILNQETPVKKESWTPLRVSHFVRGFRISSR